MLGDGFDPSPTCDAVLDKTVDSTWQEDVVTPGGQSLRAILGGNPWGQSLGAILEPQRRKKGLQGNLIDEREAGTSPRGSAGRVHHSSIIAAS